MQGKCCFVSSVLIACINFHEQPDAVSLGGCRQFYSIICILSWGWYNFAGLRIDCHWYQTFLWGILWLSWWAFSSKSSRMWNMSCLVPNSVCRLHQWLSQNLACEHSAFYLLQEFLEADLPMLMPVCCPQGSFRCKSCSRSDTVFMKTLQTRWAFQEIVLGQISVSWNHRDFVRCIGGLVNPRLEWWEYVHLLISHLHVLVVRNNLMYFSRARWDAVGCCCCV